MDTALRITELALHPIKSCGALPVESIDLTARGPRHDREWMVVDAGGRFVTQRTHPMLARVRPAIAGDRLLVLGPHTGEVLELALTGPADGLRREVEVWRDTCSGVDAGDEAASWFAALLDQPDVRLVYSPSDNPRRVDASWAPDAPPVNYADGFPLLVATQASLDALNARLEHAVPMTRFRPNVVVAGGEAWQEASWTALRVGEVTMRLVKPCTRCKVVTIDQDDGRVAVVGEPLRTLGQLRPREDGRIVFGMNAVASSGRLHRGQAVTVCDAQSAVAAVGD